MTCGAQMSWKHIQAGHYISRNHARWKYAWENVWPQCEDCNCYKAGNLQMFRIFMESRFGAAFVDDMERDRRDETRYTKSQLQEMVRAWNGQSRVLERMKIW